MSGLVREQSLAEQLMTYKPDLLVSVGWGPDHTPIKQRLVRTIATRFDIPLIYWSTEDPNFTKVFTIPLLRRMKPDYVFTVSAKTAVALREEGFPASYMDFAYHPNVHQQVQPVAKYMADIAVVANAYPAVLKRYPRLYRRQAIDILIKPLLEAGFNIDFYGRNWEKMKPYLGTAIPKRCLKGPIPYKDANQVYSSAKIMIGLQNYTDMATQRTYEAIGSGAFMLTCRTPGVSALLKSGRDAAMSSTPEETLRLVRYYLANPKEREKVRRNGRRAISSHTYTNRARDMLATLREHGIIADR
ncbi:spore maturation protein CgeB [Paenibacillus phyllosphaerae]|uniref:Spore maturation protein CgeB n=2 Tax=Paenibacillus phyllosphaerae TaxID=274593 RepID=A0A7W5B5C1_9BACL|nr:glycosyltransferase [Paenibacillus phyllosphaerae]MBB3114459.1 spore maturation protein CgeB [Paenibacillus phyllosphaerae]